MRLSNISKSYGDITVFDHLSAELPNGSVTQISGESGCGKTTLLRIIAGLEGYSGEISERPSGKISAVFQEDRLFEELSALENCYLVLKGKQPFDIAEALVSTGLSREDIARPVKELSGGMKRRTAIVRALCTDFGILLLDEPFKGIDHENKLKTAALIQAHTKGRTVLLVTHDTADIPLDVHSVLSLDK
ncbi:MAG: ATP-binding cassette domain-containing protein [Huintestinicola sp.]|uniref:ATP-binding cassette domain-containing protein n=1 Tax=Huintestinicola sp. TaxID=2981661 RepID=UPI003F035396